MTAHITENNRRLTPGRVTGLVVAALVLWLLGLMPFMAGMQSHIKRLIALVAIMAILFALVWVIRRYRYHNYITTALVSGFTAPAYYLLHPVNIHVEWVFSLTVIAISAQWGTFPGILSALMSMVGFGATAYAVGHEQYVTEALTFGGVFVAAALIVGTLAHNRESALRARARMADEMEQTYESTLKALTSALEARDQDTGGHSQRVSALTLAIAQEMQLSERLHREIQWGTLLHDVGKIGVPDRILHKTGPLTEREWRLMRRHPQIGYTMLRDIPFLQPALDIVLYHHEKFDGTGYPSGLSGEAIPLSARIFAVADVFDALTSDRPYRRAFTRSEALAEILRQSGQQFDPAVVRVSEIVVTRPDFKGFDR